MSWDNGSEELLGVFLQPNQKRQERQRQKEKQRGIEVNL